MKIIIAILFIVLVYCAFKKTYCTRWWKYNGNIVFKCKGFSFPGSNLTYGIYYATHIEKDHLQMALRQLNLIKVYYNFYVMLPGRLYKKYKKVA